MLLWVAVCERNAAAEFGPICLRPQSEQRDDGRVDAHERLVTRRVGQIALACLGVRHKRDGAQAPCLAESFVVAEEKQFVFDQWPTQRSAKLVALKRRNRAVIEVVAGIERAIADELKSCAMDLIGSTCGHDADLGTGALSICRAIGVRDYVELAHCVNAQQLTARSAGGDVGERGSCVLNSVEEEVIILWATAGDRELVAHR